MPAGSLALLTETEGSGEDLLEIRPKECEEMVSGEMEFLGLEPSLRKSGRACLCWLLIFLNKSYNEILPLTK